MAADKNTYTPGKHRLLVREHLHARSWAGGIASHCVALAV